MQSSTAQITPLPSAKRPWIALLATWILLGTPLAGSLSHAKTTPKQLSSSSQTTWPKRDFLPPMATINPRLEARQGDENSLESVDLSVNKSPTLKKHDQIKRLDTEIPIEGKITKDSGPESLRHKVEEADLEHLWQSAVQKNPVIRFSLEKLSTPSDLQSKQSSRFLTKTLSTMISGATMAAMMMPGAGTYQNMTSMAAGNALQNMMSGKNSPKPGALSPTEQIQLAGLIDELKLSIIRNYQDYQSSLQQLAQSRDASVRHSNAYTQALSSKNDMAIMAASNAYYQAIIHEQDLRHKAQLQRLALERIAGREAVARLELSPKLSDPFAAEVASKPIEKTPEKPSTQANASASPATSSQATATTISSASPSSAIGPEEPIIGPEPNETKQRKLPSLASLKPASHKTALNLPGSQRKTLELPPQTMMEIGPSLSERTETPLTVPSLSVATQPNKTLRIYKATKPINNAKTGNNKPVVNMPMMIPDRILPDKTLGISKEN